MRRKKAGNGAKIAVGGLLICGLFAVLLVFAGRRNEPDAPYKNTLYTALAAEAPAPVETESVVQKTPEKSETAAEPQEIGTTDCKTVRIYDPATDAITEMPLETYVAGATAAEMPPSFAPEARKAQAVACRTLAVRLAKSPDKSAHKGADICTDPGHCQGFLWKEAYVTENGDAGERVFEKAEQAASATKGIILLYGNEPIVAAFHASSGSFTASSAEVWGGEVAYLSSVSTHEGENKALSRQVVSTMTVSREDVLKKLKNAGFDVSAHESLPLSQAFSNLSRTPSGRVDRLTVFGQELSGSRAKTLFGLRSTDFSVDFDGENVVFTCRGHGHGVGMSQFGAQSMALEGASFYDILKYYYTGVSFGFVDV